MTKSKIEPEIIRSKKAKYTISAAVCAAEDVLSNCLKETKNQLIDFKASLMNLYTEVNKNTDSEPDVLNKLSESITNGYKKINEILHTDGHMDLALRVLKEKTRFLIAVLETHIKHMVSV